MNGTGICPSALFFTNRPRARFLFSSMSRSSKWNPLTRLGVLCPHLQWLVRCPTLRSSFPRQSAKPAPLRLRAVALVLPTEPPVACCTCRCMHQDQHPPPRSPGNPKKCTMTLGTASCPNSNSGSQLQGPRAVRPVIAASNRCCSSPMCVPGSSRCSLTQVACQGAARASERTRTGADGTRPPNRPSPSKTTPTNPSLRFSKTRKMSIRPQSRPSPAAQSRIRISTTS